MSRKKIFMIIKEQSFFNKIIIGLFLITCFVYLSSVIFIGYDFSENARSLLTPLLLLCYLTRRQKKSFLIVLFLIFYTLGETIFTEGSLSENITIAGYLNYYKSEAFYCIAYTTLLVFILLKMKFSKIVKHFSMHLVVLFLFGGYLLFTMEELPDASGYVLSDYLVYTIYNLLFILVLIFSFINYLYHDLRKALILFLACLCIVMSELVQIIYYYVDKSDIFNIVYSFLLVFGFCFLLYYFNYREKTRSIDIDGSSGD